nr:PmeII family type II restriction endonuclease [Advenella sp. EE-W14]
MPREEQERILAIFSEWFKNNVVVNHIANTEKLKNPNEFNINPFLTPYLAGFLYDELTPESVARVLIYPRVLGTSITTSFGTLMQRFISDVLKEVYGSTTRGIDIEFIDAVDGRKKYCQVKAGPQTINKDDVVTVHNHFRDARNLGKTNNLPVQQHDLVVGILYGEEHELNAHYKKLRDTHDYPIYIGKEFWYHLTGNKDFYHEIYVTISNVGAGVKGEQLINTVVEALVETDVIKEIVG